MSPRTKLLLNFIMKQEAHVLPRLFKNVGHLADAIVVDDTGSEDSSIEIVDNFIKQKGIPGKIYKEPWVDFGYNRTKNLDHAWELVESLIEKPKEGPMTASEWKQFKDHETIWYVFFMDCDNLCFKEGKGPCGGSNESSDSPEALWHFDPSKLSGDAVRVNMRQSILCYDYTFMVKYDPVKRWHWVDPLHEYLSPKGGWLPNMTKLEGGYILSGREGNRSKDPLKYLNDYVVFKRLILKEPNNKRAMFYLAQSARDFGLYALAYQHYLKRAEMSGNVADEETYIALLEAATIRLQHPEIDSFPNPEKGIVQFNNEFKIDRTSLYTVSTQLFSATYKYESFQLFMKAHEIRPTRLEAVFYIIEILRQNNLFHMAYYIGNALSETPYPKNDFLFVNVPLYEWMFYESCAISGYHAGFKARAKELFERALKSKLLVGAERERVLKNLSFC